MKIKEKIVGQVELYMALYEEGNPNDRVYCIQKSDFHTPLTKEVLHAILESFGKMGELNGFDAEKTVCEFISKEEYERATSDEDEYNTFHVKFSEED